MNYWPLLFALPCMIALAAAPPKDGSYSCTYEVKKRCTSGLMRVDVAAGQIEKFDFSISYCGLPGKLGYSCSVNGNRMKPSLDEVWRYAPSSLAVDYQSEFPENSLRIFTGEQSFIADFSRLHSGPFCGAGAELPERVTIPYKSEKCTVKLIRHQRH